MVVSVVKLLGASQTKIQHKNAVIELFQVPNKVKKTPSLIYNTNNNVKKNYLPNLKVKL